MRRLIPLALAGVLLAACTDAFTPSGVAGTYTLQSVNGNTLPYSETIEGVGFTYISGSVTLTESGTYTMVNSVDITEGEFSFTLTFPDSGTFTLTEPSTITFTDSEGEPSSGQLVGSRLTFTEDGAVYVFEK
jgi:hypothetical protein